MLYYTDMRISQIYGYADARKYHRRIRVISEICISVFTEDEVCPQSFQL